MGEIKSFQICFEGELEVRLVEVLRRLGAVPNFENSWEVHLPYGRHAAPLLRYLRKFLPPEARLLVAQTQLSRERDFLLIRHSITPGRDYSRLGTALGAFGQPIELPFEATYVLRSETPLDLFKIGEALVDFCGDDSLMVIGISHDFAIHSFGESHMLVVHDEVTNSVAFRTF